MMRHHTLFPVVTLAVALLAGCGTAQIADQRAGANAVTPATPTPGVQGTPVPAASLHDLLATYTSTSPCAGVLIDTPISAVPPPCAAIWRPMQVETVPGASLLNRAPHFPTVTAGAGVQRDEALQMATAFWRTEAFRGFAVGTRQLGVADALGKEHLFLRTGAEEIAVLKGETVSTPLCHFFPSAMEVVQLAPDFSQFQQRTGRTLGVHARFIGPCYATATDAHGTTTQLFSFNGAYDVLYVGDVHSSDAFGTSLWITGLAECTKDVAKKTCAE